VIVDFKNLFTTRTQKMNTYHVSVLGEVGVGKTALTFRFTHSIWIHDNVPTVELDFRKQVTVDDEACVVDILGNSSFTIFFCLDMKSKITIE
jgi:GTPase SAR1 family protein